MSWFFNETPSTPQIANIFPKDYFYYLTKDYNLSGLSIQFSESGLHLRCEDSLKNMPNDGLFVVYPKTVIDKINLGQDLQLKIMLEYQLPEDKTKSSYNTNRSRKTHFASKPLGFFLTEPSILENSKYLCMALMTGGEDCINLEDSTFLLSQNIILPNFVDITVREKLETCIYKLLFDGLYPLNNTGKFKISNSDETINIAVEVSWISSDFSKTIYSRKHSVTSPILIFHEPFEKM